MRVLLSLDFVRRNDRDDLPSARSGTNIYGGRINEYRIGVDKRACIVVAADGL
jgi:hypothetical protein